MVYGSLNGERSEDHLGELSIPALVPRFCVAFLRRVLGSGSRAVFLNRVLKSRPRAAFSVLALASLSENAALPRRRAHLRV